MKKTSLITLLFLLTLTQGFSGQLSESFSGYWTNDKNNVVIEIKEKGKHYIGVLVWMEPTAYQKLSSNEDSPIYNQKYQEFPMLKNFKKEGDQLVKGSLVNLRNGKEYSGEMSLVDPKTLNIFAWVGVKWMGKNVQWKRTSKPQQ